MTTTDYFQKNPDFFIGSFIRRENVNTNPRYKRFNQTHFTAGDENQFTMYRDYSNEKDKKINLPKISNWILRNVDWEGYSNLEKKYVYTTFKYLFYKFKKAIFIKIHDNQLKVFLPFSKAIYHNEWSEYLRQHPSYNHINDFIKYCANLQKFSINDSNINSHINTWYANNFLFRPEYPQKEGDSGIGSLRDMLIELCKNRELPDMECFINKRDFPLLKRDYTESYYSMFNSHNMPLISHKYEKYYPILSMCTRENYADIPIPTIEDWARISNIEDNKFFHPPRSYKYHFNTNFSTKKPIAVFRGASTGEYTTIEKNMRLKIAHLSSQMVMDNDNNPFLDAGITKWNTRPRKEYGSEYITTIEHDKLPFGLVPPLSPEEQSNYKYIINIDGHVSAFRLSLELSMGSVILLVDSEYKLWFHPMLKEYEHFVPVKSDLSNIYEQIKWCKENDKKCSKIAENAINFYKKYLCKEGIFDYFQLLFIKLKKQMGNYPYNKYSIKDLQYFLVKNKITKNSFSRERYIKDTILIKGGVSISKIENESDRCCKKVDFHSQKYSETLQEIFVGNILNQLKNIIPTFSFIHDYKIDESNNIYLIKDWIDGPTFDIWIKKYYNINDFLLILLQINLAILLSQIRFGFIHYDLFPWNIIIKTYKEPITIEYPYLYGKTYKITTNVVPYIFDYGKSSIIYKKIRYGNLRICSIQDTLTILFTSLYEAIQHKDKNIGNLLYLSNFITNSEFRKKPFKTARELRIFLKYYKNYDTLITFDKKDLYDKDTSQFIVFMNSLSINGVDYSYNSCLSPKKQVSYIDPNINKLDFNNKYILYFLAPYIDDICNKQILGFDQQILLLKNIETMNQKEKKIDFPQYNLLNKFLHDMEYGNINFPEELRDILKKYKNVDYMKFQIDSERLIINPQYVFFINSIYTYKFYAKLIYKLNSDPNHNTKQHISTYKKHLKQLKAYEP